MPNYLQSAQDGLVIDINNQGGVQSGSPLQALVMKAEANQYWTTEDVPGRPGYFWIVSSDDGLVIDISNQGGVQSGSPLQALEKKNETNQYWTTEAVPGQPGYFWIVSADDGLVIDISNQGGAQSGSPLQALVKKDEANQYWTWLPTEVTFAVPTTGFGSGPTNANFSATLTLHSDGTVYFAGQYQDTGSIPVFDAPSQSYQVTGGVLGSNKIVYTFSHSNPGVPTGGAVDAWGPQTFLNSVNPAPNSSTVVPDDIVHSEIAAAWASIAKPQGSTFKAENNSAVAGILGEIVSWAETIVDDAVQVVAVIAAVAA